MTLNQWLSTPGPALMRERAALERISAECASGVVVVRIGGRVIARFAEGDRQ